MSVESAKSFVERMKTDEDFAKAVTECKDSEGRKEFIVAKGFDFTVDELSQARGNELNDEQLEAVSAGVGPSIWRCGLGDYACANVPSGQYN